MTALATDPRCWCGSTDLVSGWWTDLRWTGCRTCGALYLEGGRLVGREQSTRAWVEVHSRGPSDRLVLFACPWCTALPATWGLPDHVASHHGEIHAAIFRDALARAAA